MRISVAEGGRGYRVIAVGTWRPLEDSPFELEGEVPQDVLTTFSSALDSFSPASDFSVGGTNTFAYGSSQYRIEYEKSK